MSLGGFSPAVTGCCSTQAPACCPAHLPNAEQAGANSESQRNLDMWGFYIGAFNRLQTGHIFRANLYPEDPQIEMNIYIVLNGANNLHNLKCVVGRTQLASRHHTIFCKKPRHAQVPREDTVGSLYIVLATKQVKTERLTSRKHI